MLSPQDDKTVILFVLKIFHYSKQATVENNTRSVFAMTDFIFNIMNNSYTPLFTEEMLRQVPMFWRLEIEIILEISCSRER